jgi:preprotein translocase subunit Sec61beta
MNKKEIESPKLTANFLVWIGLFVFLMLLVAHYVLKFF